MSLDQKDTFKDLQFNGQPSGYRDFRRKTLLAVASLEDKHAHLAGPRLLSRLSGEAWRTTEHLPINKLRSSEGWLEVIKALDNHCRYLPETELHEAREEFLFQFKRRHHEGATSFSSRFRTQLDRVQTLIAQEREMVRRKRRKKEPLKSTASSSLDETSDEDDDGAGSYGTARGPSGPVGSTTAEPARQQSAEAGESAASQSAAAPDPAATSATAPEGTRAPSADGDGSKSRASASHAGSKVGSKRRHETHSRATFEEDHAFGLRKMQQFSHRVCLDICTCANMVCPVNKEHRSSGPPMAHHVLWMLSASCAPLTWKKQKMIAVFRRLVDVKPMQFQPNETNSKCSWPTTMSHRNW